MQIETRHYEENNTTEEEKELIRRRMSFYSEKERIIFWDEMPAPTIYSEDLMFERLDELTKNMPSFYLLINISNSERPSAELREHIRDLFRERIQKIEHAAVYTMKNFMLNVAAKFIMGKLGFKSYSIHRTQEEAIEAIQNHEQRPG